jgi:hypothetical protein
MPDRLAGLIRYMWPERGTASAVCMDRRERPMCTWSIEKIDYAPAAAKARKHTRDTGHDTRVYHRRIVEYSAEEAEPDG